MSKSSRSNLLQLKVLTKSVWNFSLNKSAFISTKCIVGLVKLVFATVVNLIPPRVGSKCVVEGGPSSCPNNFQDNNFMGYMVPLSSTSDSLVYPNLKLVLGFLILQESLCQYKVSTPTNPLLNCHGSCSS